MYARLFFSTVFIGLTATTAAAQDQHVGHVMPTTDATVSAARQGSGTSWLPDETPVYALHRQSGDWMLMGHGSMFLQYLRESGDRGSQQTGSINWLMGMAQRPAGAGRLTLRGMVSVEPWTIDGCGYPDLLAIMDRFVPAAVWRGGG